jgi:hypothetical protein
VSNLKALSDLVEKYMGKGQEDFLAEFPDSLMILDDVGEESVEEVGFQTIQVNPNGNNPKERALTSILGKLGGDTTKWIYPMHNATGKFACMLTVGRAANSDMRLNVASLSKFHAYLTHVARENSWYLADAGSSNGTFLNGEELPQSHGKKKLDSGSAIRFGPDVLATFYKAADFWELLQSAVGEAQG